MADEYIKKKAALEVIQNLYPGTPFTKRLMQKWHEENKNFMQCESAIERLPAADVAPVRHGRWFMRGGKWRCSECDQKALLRLSDATGGCREYEYYRANYCPNCGAKMGKEAQP